MKKVHLNIKIIKNDDAFVCNIRLALTTNLLAH